DKTRPNIVYARHQTLSSREWRKRRRRKKVGLSIAGAHALSSISAEPTPHSARKIGSLQNPAAKS
ncbi:MAG TPA: hypothetical protein VL147_06670, partial [Devosia sp.]|nr:hypothetical protein [Devosia sp.]